MIRMIPCMAGCAGPTLRSMSLVSSSRGVRLGASDRSTGGVAFVTNLVDWPYQGLPLVDRKVFSERMADELGVHQDALQVRMSPEPDPEHVPDLPLEPVSTGP